MDFSDPVGVRRRFRLGVERRQLGMGRYDGFQKRLRSAWRLMGDMGEPGVLRKGNRSIVRVYLPRNQAQKRRLAGAVTAHKPNLMSLGDASRRVLEQRPPLDAV